MRLYADLAWLWPMGGDATEEYAQYGAHVATLIRQGGPLRIETDRWKTGLFAIETWRRVLRDTGFEPHEEPFGLGEDTCTVFACRET